MSNNEDEFVDKVWIWICLKINRCVLFEMTLRDVYLLIHEINFDVLKIEFIISQ